MGFYHRWEDFPQREITYLKDHPQAKTIKIRVLSAEKIMISEIKVEGKGIVPRHCHEAEQIIIFLKGEALVTTSDDTPRLLKPGDIWIVPSNVMHGVEYLTDVEALEIVSPPRLDNFIGYTIRKTFFEDDKKEKSAK